MLIAQVAALLVAGFLLSRVARSALEVVNQLLFYVTIPLSLVISLAKLGSLLYFAVTLAVATLHMAATLAVSIAVARSSGPRWGKEVVLLSSLPNSLFIALPLSAALLGDAAYAVPHAVASNFVLVALLAYFGTSGPSRVRRALALYAFSLTLGLALNAAGAYSMARGTFDWLNSAVSTANMLSFALVGASIGGLRELSRGSARGLALTAAIRYAASPALLAALLAAAGALGAEVGEGFVSGMQLQSLMPPAIMCIVVGRALRMDNGLIAAAIALLTPISVALALALF